MSDGGWSSFEAVGVAGRFLEVGVDPRDLRQFAGRGVVQEACVLVEKNVADVNGTAKQHALQGLPRRQFGRATVNVGEMVVM